ncbi:MAG: ABC transporter ATP-binding protein [Candidatus Omnitrophica bacterium]|nr:ABC transporter ATP-binding protein [Candidatus Omnitrophota bacterium]
MKKNNSKELNRSLFYYSRIFWQMAGLKLPLFIFLCFAGGITEGIGISLLLPLFDRTNVSRMVSSKWTAVFDGFLAKTGLDNSIQTILLCLFAAFTLKAVFTFLQNMIRIWITSSLSRDWKRKVISLYERMDYRHFLNSNTGFFTNLITVEIERAISAFLEYAMLLSRGVSILVYLAFSLALSPTITAAGFLCSIFFMYLMRWSFQLSKRYSHRTSEQGAFLQSELIQMFSSFKYLKATESFSRLKEKVYHRIYQVLHLEIKKGLVRWWLRGCLELSSAWLILGIIFYQVVIHQGSLSSVIVVVLFLHRTVQAINDFQISWQGFCSMVGGLSVFMETCKTLENQTEKVGLTKIESFSHQIELKGVHYRYESKPILTDIHVMIPKNQTIAFVGDSGAGKTTLIDIITGLLKPQAGEILVDGIPYPDIDLGSLRAKIGYVTQDAVIFNDTIANNISLWKDEGMPAGPRMVKAAQLSDAYDFIMNTEHQFETRLGDRGVKISGGQKQRLAITREIYKEAQIIIFDEATSSLDSESESVIQKSIQELRSQVTMILIAHRLSTIKNADYIYVLDQGRIIQEGTFDFLYHQSDSKFRIICELQRL